MEPVLSSPPQRVVVSGGPTTTGTLDVLQPSSAEKKAVPPETLCCGVLEKDESDPDFGCLVGPVLLSALIVVCGTTSTVTSKIMYEVRSHGTDRCRLHDDDGDDDATTYRCKFTKPWFQTLVMKVAMSLCYLIHKLSRWYRQTQVCSSGVAKKKAVASYRDVRSVRAANPQDLSEPLLYAEEDDGVGDLEMELSPRERFTRRFPTPKFGAVLFIAYPAMTDLVQTVLAQAGLLWVPSSVYQMCRGSVIIFTCFLSIRYMNKTMSPVHWISIGIVCVAIALVGVAGIFGEDDGGVSLGTYVLGIGLIVLGQVVGAVQFVLEEYIMAAGWGVTPTLLVGWEGIWGVVFFIFLTPALYYSPRDGGSPAAAIWHEDIVDTWTQLTNSKYLVVINVISAVALLVYNMVGNMVTKQLSSIMRSILESCRTLGVWFTGLVLWYHFKDKNAGEQWTNASFLEAFGFILLVYGTVAYKGIVKIPGMPPAND